MLNYFNFHSLRNFIGVKERSIDQKLFSVYAFSFMRVCYYYYSNCVRFSISRRPFRSESSSWWVTIVLRSSPLYQKHTHTHLIQSMYLVVGSVVMVPLARGRAMVESKESGWPLMS